MSNLKLKDVMIVDVNHGDDRAQLPLAQNEREWLRRMMDEGHDWYSLSSMVIPDEQSLRTMEDAAHDRSKGVVSGNLFINTSHIRQVFSRKNRMSYQKDKDVVRSVKLWFREIEGKGGKTMFVEDATLTGFAYGWCTKFQLMVK
ncbi:hypothetical protein EDD21DRAFT_421400 [Dissophora ornata]|nr:hypothetical protein EDD21DRAFT_421400 [Dissophora ornata]